MKKFDEIIKLLDDSKVKYEIVEREPAKTSEHAEKVTGWSSTNGAKSLIFKLDSEFVLVVVKGTNLVDFNKLRKYYKIRKARLATVKEVLKVTGVNVGACYPFPKVANIRGIVDKSLVKSKQISFSPGSDKHHIRMSFADFQKLANPTLVDIAKD